MQYFMSSSFISIACIVNITIHAVLPVLGYLVPDNRLLYVIQMILSTFGVLFNCFVLLEARRKLNLRKFSQQLRSYVLSMRRKFDNLCCHINVANVYARLASIDLYNLPGLSNLMTVLRISRGAGFYMINSDATSKVNLSTPAAHSTQYFRDPRAHSDPLMSEKANIKAKYLPAKTPELFKHKIYLTRRNLAN